MSAENVEIVRRSMEGFQAGDIDAQLEFMANDVELIEWPESPDTRTFRGHEGALEALASWADAWSSLTTHVDEYIDAGESVIVCGTTRGKGKGSEIEVDIPTFNVYRLREGKIARIQFFIDKEQALQAAGVGERSAAT